MIIVKHFIKILFLLLLIKTYSFAQTVGIGEWRDHLPYQSTISVTDGENKIYCATPYSLFYLNQSDNSINRITTISGLSDIGIVKIGYNKAYSTLLIAYSNTNIDLIKGDEIINMSDIINSSAITPEEKAIYNLMFIDNLAYLSCGFGIVVLDIKKEEIVDTYYIGPNGSHLKVFDLTHNDTSFLAATESGLYFADVDNPNLAYFGSWSKDQSLPFPDETYSHIVTNSDKIYISKDSEIYGKDTVLFYENSQWNYGSNIKNGVVENLRTFNDQLYIVYISYIDIFDKDNVLLSNIWKYNEQANPASRDVVIDENNQLWIADYKNGLVRQNSEYNYTFIYPNGPLTADVYAMSAEGNTLWTVAGGMDLSWNNLFKRVSASSFADEDWNTLYDMSSPSLENARDLVCVAVNPTNHNQVFAGSWTIGMLEFENMQFDTLYTPENSGLDYKNNQGNNICKVGGLTFDKSGNLWAISSHANNLLSVRIPDGSPLGEWHSFYLGSFSSTQDAGELVIDNYNQKWIRIRAEHSLIVFNDNNTITNPSDDEVKVLTSAAGNGNIPGNKVFSLEVDNDGEVWIGTDEGVAVFYSPENVFSSYNYDAQRILIPRNDGTGLADILLEFETVTAIAVDGANNKWIGTDRSGVFLLSPDGQEEIHHFTQQNSPLLSNNITSIAIKNDGEVFFGTANGVISYRGSATPGTETNSDVYAYPNPVKPGYNGPIAITGLVANASFKVTDISGNLIYSGIAEGGQAIWNGNNFEGRRAQSGVYLVFVTNDDGSEKVVTKILFIN